VASFSSLVEQTLAYYKNSLITDKKSFMTLGSVVMFVHLRTLTTRCILVRVNVGIQTIVYLFLKRAVPLEKLVAKIQSLKNT
jgi:hypothetical protein